MWCLVEAGEWLKPLCRVDKTISRVWSILSCCVAQEQLGGGPK